MNQEDIGKRIQEIQAEKAQVVSEATAKIKELTDEAQKAALTQRVQQRLKELDLESADLSAKLRSG